MAWVTKNWLDAGVWNVHPKNLDLMERGETLKQTAFWLIPRPKTEPGSEEWTSSLPFFGQSLPEAPWFDSSLSWGTMGWKIPLYTRWGLREIYPYHKYKLYEWSKAN